MICAPVDVYVSLLTVIIHKRIHINIEIIITKYKHNIEEQIIIRKIILTERKGPFLTWPK